MQKILRREDRIASTYITDDFNLWTSVGMTIRYSSSHQRCFLSGDLFRNQYVLFSVETKVPTGSGSKKIDSNKFKAQFICYEPNSTISLLALFSDCWPNL